MDFDYTDEQHSLREATARWIERAHPFERRHALAKAGGASRAVLGELAALGLTAIAVPEAHGGLGFGAVEAMVVMEELGRGLVSAPLADAAIVAPALLAAAPDDVAAAWLPRIASGDALVVPALQERTMRYDWRDVRTTARGGGNDGTGWTIDGHKGVVASADEADAFVVTARIGDGGGGGGGHGGSLGLFVVERGAAGVEVRAYPTQDGARAGEVVMTGAKGVLVERDADASVERAVDAGIAAACAEGSGLMQRLMELTVEYLNTRKQFGVALATFQALRHRAADVKMAVELGRSMSYYATLTQGAPREARRRAASRAKVQLGQSMRFVAQACTQMHGGIGITDEYAGSHYLKRLTMLEFAHGDTLHHLGRLSESMQDSAGVFD